MCNISPNIFFDAAIDDTAESVRRNNVDEADDDDVATVDIDVVDD